MRTLLTGLAVVIACTGSWLSAAPAQSAQPAEAPAPPIKLASGWTGRVDDHSADPTAIKAEPERGGLHVLPGPAALFERGISASDKFVVTVRFTAPRQTGPTTPAGGFGIFIGASDLDAPAHHYTALLIRESGEYAVVRHLANGQLRYIVNWTKHAALPGSTPLPSTFHPPPPPPDEPERPARRRSGESGGMGILMQVDVGQGDVRLLINGAEIASVAAADVDTDGLVGVRVRADTDIAFSNFDVTGNTKKH